MLADQTSQVQWVMPPTTAAKLAAEVPKGQRHYVAVEIATSLVGAGFASSEIYRLLREKFEADVSDRELISVVNWAVDAQPDRPKSNQDGLKTNALPSSRHPEMGGSHFITNDKPNAHIENLENPSLAAWWTDDLRLEANAVASESPVPLPDLDWEATNAAFTTLYKEGESINIVTDFRLDGPKARPNSSGALYTRDAWMDQFAATGVPASEAGAWIRMNPVAGGISDANVTSHRFLLLESDSVPLETQLGFFTRLRLPIAMIVTSGAASVHAWVRLDAPDAERYKVVAARIMAALKPFGIDTANSNASRLSRLPGATRVIGAKGDGVQRLVWLNRLEGEMTDAQLDRFEETLKSKSISNQPLSYRVDCAVERFDALYKNRGHLGVPFGIPDLDRVSGGIKPGQTIVVSGRTGGGKSTLGLHMILAALRAGVGVALFTLEADGDEVMDQIVSHQCLVNRNIFNTGEFTDEDRKKIWDNLPALKRLPLYIEDNPSVYIEDIEKRVMQLRDDGRIGLVVIDYIQFINTKPVNGQLREQEVAATSHSLRRLARASQIPQIVLSQTNDNGDLRESRVVGHNANVVIAITVEEDRVTLEVKKGRGVPCGKHYMTFDRLYCRFLPGYKGSMPYDENDPFYSKRKHK